MQREREGEGKKTSISGPDPPKVKAHTLDILSECRLSSLDQMVKISSFNGTFGRFRCRTNASTCTSHRITNPSTSKTLKTLPIFSCSYSKAKREKEEIFKP
eukprot:TRINITY_DN57_c0_g1_i3.p1 TRINITY_DN57_c0_g1~~TRINITY_DN57_c0_g1_i3.p1  ORF type:complete len:101 (+),score=9.13 TRINITY_DN57_c0_g1_i3:23-325(+)